MHFYIVCETENLTTTNYVDLTQSVHASFVDNTFHVHINKFFSLYFVSCGLVDTALAKLRHSPSAWGSLLHKYPQSLFYLTRHRRIITKCTVLKKDDPGCGNFLWNGLPMGFEFTISMPINAHAYGFCFYFV